MLDHVFHTNIIAYCQQNWYVRLAIYTDSFTLIIFKGLSLGQIIIIFLEGEKLTLKFKLFFYRSWLPEADLGLLQHPRWSAL